MELVTNEEIDLLFIQESWLRKCDGATLAEIKEYGYSIITERKTRKFDRGGGVALIYKNKIQLKKIKCKQYPSFESLTVTLQSVANAPVFTNLYYPGYSAKHKFTKQAFIEDFCNLWENDLENCNNKIFGRF